MLTLTLVAAGPWIAYAPGVGESARAAGPEGDIEHWNFTASIALLIPLWGLIGASDKPGWALPAGAAVLASACVGLQSLLFPDALAGLQPMWTWAAVAWCIAYGVAAWFRLRRDRDDRPPKAS